MVHGRAFVVVSLLLMALPLSGCATLFADGSQTLTFTSSPAGAEVYVDGRMIGRTPVSVVLDKRHGATVATVRARGYHPRQFLLQKTLDTIAILNLSSLLSWATDFGTGNMFEYQPGSYYVELDPDQGGGPASPYYVHRARRRFVLVAHSELVRELVRGDGEYLDALAHLYQVPQDRAAAFSAALRDDMPQLLAPVRPHEFFAVLDPLARAGYVPGS